MTTAPQDARIGGYRLISLLGEGGMGIVHLAQDERGHRVALKLLRPHVVGDQQARDRFAQEVSSLSRVTSDRVAEIVAADPWAEEPYVATRYVAGPSLTEHVRQHGPLQESALRRFAAGLAEALAAVHRVGVLHRDVKPGNVLVEDGEPVLIDFGLARMAEDPHLTSTGWLLGTPGYLAPEILYGDEPTPAADVHAWAATVVFAATGRPPAGRGPAMAIMDRVRRGEFDLRGLPGSLDRPVRRALAEDPLDRPTVPELLTALGAHQPPPPTEEPTLFLERTRVLPPPYDPPLRPQPPQESPLESHPEPLPRSLAPEPPYDPWHADSYDASEWPPEPVRRGRQRFALLGLGAAAAALVACVPYVGGAVLAVLVAILRFGSVVMQRHGERRYYRGRARWWDVPASTLLSPAYLLFSLGGTLLLLVWTAAAVAAVALVLTALGVSLAVGMGVIGAVTVLSVWWGPGSARVRSMGRRITIVTTRPGRSGLVLGGLGVFAAVVLLLLAAVQGPAWTPGSAAPWTDGWLAGVRDALR